MVKIMGKSKQHFNRSSVTFTLFFPSTFNLTWEWLKSGRNIFTVFLSIIFTVDCFEKPLPIKIMIISHKIIAWEGYQRGEYCVKGTQWMHRYARDLSYFPSDRLSEPRVTHCPTPLPHNVFTGSGSVFSPNCWVTYQQSLSYQSFCISCAAS